MLSCTKMHIVSVTLLPIYLYLIAFCSLYSNKCMWNRLNPHYCPILGALTLRKQNKFEILLLLLKHWEVSFPLIDKIILFLFKKISWQNHHSHEWKIMWCFFGYTYQYVGGRKLKWQKTFRWRLISLLISVVASNPEPLAHSSNWTQALLSNLA